uniref:Cholecystoxin n=1 Tax=Varanus varius TaxID=8559 RepID=CCT1_VARVA|nr:RecName: Full=Cholecystoxin; AltName: Full=Cholecystoxin-Vvar1; Contains: RecName: Full=Cholecystoxin-22; Short=CCK-22; Contains: RecName: Full=Cholecystoxin-8; Short=CCK-8; Flags: Precursor [Varanus varius]ADK39225.1 cholecystoxin-Vvar1 [Varanus varius]
MYGGICLCVLLAVLAISSSGQHISRSLNGNSLAAAIEQNFPEKHRPARTPDSNQRVESNIDEKANLGVLLARYLQKARRGTNGKPPDPKKESQDYLGWMDFGRRSAEEYEYSS